MQSKCCNILRLNIESFSERQKGNQRMNKLEYFYDLNMKYGPSVWISTQYKGVLIASMESKDNMNTYKIQYKYDHF